MILTERQQKLLEFVKVMHQEYPLKPENAFRKYTGEEYWTHPYAVAEIVYEHEPEAVEEALCHDLLEDTKCDWEQLFDALSSFGYTESECVEICTVVTELTNIYNREDYPKLHRKERKSKEVDRLSKISYKGQSVKYGDIIHNRSSINEKDKNFAKTYLEEGLTVLKGMRNGNFYLLAKATQTIMNGINDNAK